MWDSHLTKGSFVHSKNFHQKKERKWGKIMENNYKMKRQKEKSFSGLNKP